MPLQRVRSRLHSTVGGVMTEEVGAITGELDVETTGAGNRVDVRIAYADADEWYTPLGSPVLGGLGGTRNLRHLHRLHQQIVVRLTTPGPIMHGNEQPVDLVGWRP